MNTATETNRREIDAYAVALDETEHYNIDPADAPYIQRIDGVYLFDRNEKTHCCELTASYYLIYLYASVVFTDDISDDLRNKLDEKYAHEPSDDIYVHCHTVDRIVAAGKPYTVSHYGDVGPDDLADDLQETDVRHNLEMEAIREDMCANCPF